MDSPLFVPGARRHLLQGALGLGMGLALAQAAVPASAGGAASAPAPARTAPRGRPGEFDFLSGEWKIRHRRLKTPGGSDWDEFDGEATCWSILGGVVSIEELRIPARNFSGMGIRILDVPQALWRELWVNAKSGVLEGPGMPGGLAGGTARFEADDDDNGKPIKVLSLWDRITPRNCRWQQAVSRDGGATWETGWLMEWTRA